MDRFLFFAVFLLVLIAIGMISSRKIRSVDDFVLGGRRMGPWLSTFSYGTTYFSAVVFVGYAGRFGWSFGLSATWVGIGNAVIGSLLAWLLLARRTRRITAAMGVQTMAEFFRERYDSRGLERFAAVIIFVFLIPYSASVYQGLGYILQVFFRGTALADPRLSMALMAVVTALYLVFGGMMSTALNSVVQGFVMLLGVIFMIWRVVAATGGWNQAVSTLSSIGQGGLTEGAGTIGATFPAGALVAPLGPSPIDLVAIILLTSLGTLGLPQMISKFQSVRDARAARRATIMSTVFALIIGGGAYFMGSFSRPLMRALSIDFDGRNLDQVMPLAFEAILTPNQLALLVLLMLSASMSTLAAVVLVSAPTFSRTILGRRGILPIRLMSLLFVAVSYVIAVVPSAIFELMSLSWGAVAGSFVGPYILGLYCRRITRSGAWIGMISGLSTVCLGAVLVTVTGGSRGIWSPRLAVLAMLISLAVTWTASRLSGSRAQIPKGAEYV